MKKFIVILIIVAVFASVFAFAGCDNKNNNNNNTNDNTEDASVNYTFVAPDGAPALAIAGLSDSITTDTDTYKLNMKVVSSTSIGTEALKSDIAIVPANMAAKLYNGGNDIRLLSVVTNGNLFLMSSGETEMTDLEALKGRMVYSIGQGSVPDMIFQSLLRSNDIVYKQGEYAVAGMVVIKYFLNGNEVINQMALAQKSGNIVYGMLAEPAVTMAKGKGFFEVMDMQSLWAESAQSEYQGYAQAVLIAKASVCEDKQFIAKLLDAVSANAKSVAEDPEKAVLAIKELYPQTTLQNGMTKEVVKRCNIAAVTMPSGKAYYEQMLETVMKINDSIIGGKLPDDNFYYAG